MSIQVLAGDCLAVLPGLEADSFAACVCDPPYEIGFMGRSWDRTGVAFRPETWEAVLRVLKPGAHLVAFGGTRTYHRLACAIEDAGFEVRDQLAWVTGQGFPKSRDVSKAIDRAAGAEREVVGVSRKMACPMNGAAYCADRPPAIRPDITAPATEAARQWQGWGTALKPAWEPIVLARKPLSEGTVTANVLRWGTGAINIDASRIPTGKNDPNHRPNAAKHVETVAGGLVGGGWGPHKRTSPDARWPTNLAHDGSPEVLAAFARFGSGQSGVAVQRNGGGQKIGGNGIYGGSAGLVREDSGYADSGSPARFFFTAKAASWEREGDHPTVKPVTLMEWLVRLVTPPGGAVLDPFAGTGSTLVACDWLGIEAVGIELDATTCADAERKIKRLRARRLLGHDAPRHEAMPGQLELL